MPFGDYIKQLGNIILSSSLALGLIVGSSLLVNGEMTMEIDLTLEFEAIDGIWFLIGVPVIMTLVFLLLSPLSYGIYRLLTRRRGDDPGQDH